jgi:hypothetical protein
MFLESVVEAAGDVLVTPLTRDAQRYEVRLRR